MDTGAIAEMMKSSKGSDISAMAIEGLKRVARTLEKPANQRKIASLASSASKESVMQFAAMGGVPMDEKVAVRVTKFANSITEEQIQKSVSYAKRAARFVAVANRVLKFVGKYKYLFVYFVLWKFIKRAFGPIAVNSKKKK